MASLSIQEGTSLFTLVNVMEVAPENQQELLERLIDTTRRHILPLPGVVGASFHKSTDGTKILNYGQWTDRESWQAMVDSPMWAEHIATLGGLGKPNLSFYEVSAVLTAEDAAADTVSG